MTALIVIAVLSVILLTGCIGVILYCLYVRRKQEIEAIFANHTAEKKTVEMVQPNPNAAVPKEPEHEGVVVSIPSAAKRVEPQSQDTFAESDDEEILPGIDSLGGVVEEDKEVALPNSTIQGTLAGELVVTSSVYLTD